MTDLATERPDLLDPRLVDRLVNAVAAGPDAARQHVVAPFTGEPIAAVPVSTPADVEQAYVLARAAQREWARRPVRERAGVLRRLHDLVLDRQSLVADVVQLESGKARRDAFEEIGDVALAARHTASVAPRLLRTRRRAGIAPLVTRGYEVRHPKGVVGIVSPWNYPFTLAISDALPAFAAGNAVVHKPDTQTVLTALLGRALAVEAGLPEQLWQVVVGPGPVVGTAVVEGADHVAFTGSTRTGRHIAAEAGRRLVGVSLELGGKNPMLVLADADVSRSVEGAVLGCFANAGQLCVSSESLYVADEIYEEFVRRLVERVRRLRLGPAMDYSADVGSLSSAEQLTKVTAHVEDAVAKGATVLVGGGPRPDLGPWFFEPTLLSGVRPGMLAADDETFGPVVAVYRFTGEDEAVAAANATPYGLNASIWTRDTRRGVRLAKRLHHGAVNVNESYRAVWGSHELHLGGMKASGLGRRHGSEGLLRYTEVQSVAVQRVHGIHPPPWMGYEDFARYMTRYLRASHRGRRG
jgi:succinate-semialdehyde dehydrogenase / glutarate-semialdehyde dehydrogenase